VSRIRKDLPGVRSEDGLSLVEIVVSMLLLAIITVAMVPLLMQGLAQSARVSTLAAATQLLEQQMELLRATAPPCGSAAATSVVATTTDSRNIPLAATRTVAACPSSFPGTIKVDVSVSRTDTNVVLSTASTLVYDPS